MKDGPTLSVEEEGERRKCLVKTEDTGPRKVMRDVYQTVRACGEGVQVLVDKAN